MLRHQWLLAATIAFVILFALVVTAPFMSPYGMFIDLDGNGGYVDNGWLGHGVADAIYYLGDITCHQEAARSFVLNGSQLPVCIRCCGIFAGLSIGFAICWLIDSGLENRMVTAWTAFVTLMAVTWAYEGLVSEDMPTLRFISGLLAGVGAALFLVWLLYKRYLYSIT